MIPIKRWFNLTTDRWREWFDREAEWFTSRELVSPFAKEFYHAVADLEDEGELRKDRIESVLGPHLGPLNLLEIEFLQYCLETVAGELEYTMPRQMVPLDFLYEITHFLNDKVDIERLELESRSDDAMADTEAEYTRLWDPYWKLVREYEGWDPHEQ